MILSKFILLALTFIAFNYTIAQENPTLENPLKYNVFLDSYYTKASNSYKNNQRPYSTQAVNVESVSLNFALAQISYTKENYRIFLGVHTGTYVQFNYAAEPQLAKNIYEATGGIKLGKDLWLDVGIFESHIGMENAISRDNINYTRSLMAENSPYYESGAKLSYDVSDKLHVKLLLLNGWQVIQDNNKDISTGTQVTYQFLQNLSATWSTYIGNDAPDNKRKQMRYFNHFNLQYKINDDWELMAAYDYGIEKKPFYSLLDRYGNNDLNLFRQTQDDGYFNFSTGAIQLRYHINEKLRLGARTEWYLDKSQVIVKTNTPNGYQIRGGSLNLDYYIHENALIRIEGKSLHSLDSIYPNKNQNNRKDNIIVSSLAVWF
jgi:hypothetical protein